MHIVIALFQTSKHLVMKYLVLFLLFISTCGTLFSQIPVLDPVVSSENDYPALKGDQVITRKYQGDQTLTHYRHNENEYVHSFIIHKSGLNGYTKRMQFNLNAGVEPDEAFRKLTVNDMRIEGDSCYFCGKLTLIGPVIYDAFGNPIWPESDIGLMGFFSITDLIAGNVTLNYKCYYETSEFTRLTTWTYTMSQTRYLSVGAIGMLRLEPYPCVLELTHSNNTWRESLGHTNSTGEVFSDILYNSNRLIIASYHQCNGDEGDFQYEPNHWKFTLHCASRYGYCMDYGHETAAEYDTYGLTINYGTTGWHFSDAQLRLCKLKNGRTCMAYGAKDDNTHPNILLFSMLDPFVLDTIMVLYTDFGYSIVHDMVGLLGGENTVALLSFSQSVAGGRLHFPMISTTTTTYPFMDIVSYTKLSVDKWGPYTAILGGYRTSDNVIWEFRQNKAYLHPTYPPISCFMSGYSFCEAIGRLDGEKGDYDWTFKYKYYVLSWETTDCTITSENCEYICTETFFEP